MDVIHLTIHFIPNRYAYQLGDTAKVKEVMKKFDEALKNFPKCVECYVLFAQVMYNLYSYSNVDTYCTFDNSWIHLLQG